MMQPTTPVAPRPAFNLLGGRAPGDFWGGLAAMLVALPASIAFGVTVYAAIGPAYAAYGALAGVIGATVIALVASTLGGTDRLISAPCAPAAAVLSAFAIELVGQGLAPGVIVRLLITLGVLAGVVQLLLGFIGVGRLIRYIPYPVVSGYLSAVGLILIGSQISKFVGAPEAQTPMQLQEMEPFARHKVETLKELESRMQLRTYQAGEPLYLCGAAGDELYWVRRGTVRIVAPLGAGRTKHMASFGRGDFFGGLAFLDNQPRSNDAVADTPTEVYVLSREQFNQIAEGHKKLAFNLVTAIARALALRLRHADSELAILQEY